MQGDPADAVARIAARYRAEDAELLELTLARLAWRSAHSAKACSSCREDLPLSAFGPDTARPDGLAHRCRACDSRRKRAARKARSP